MAEFSEVMRQAKRMCEAQNDCEECPIFEECEGSGHISLDCTADAEAVERKTMDWAAAHPEPVYPSWNKAWKQLFPDMAEKDPPCFRYFISSARLEEFCPGMRCETCRNQPLFADIAEKLGIKPIGGDEDA